MSSAPRVIDCQARWAGKTEPTMAATDEDSELAPIRERREPADTHTPRHDERRGAGR